MLATYTRLVRPSHSGMMSPASKGICDGRSDRTHHPPRPMMMAVGTAVPTVTSTPIRRADATAPAKAASVVPQKMTSMMVTRKALLSARSGSNT